MSKNTKILFISTKSIFPIDTGDKRIIFERLKFYKENHKIYFVFFYKKQKEIESFKKYFGEEILLIPIKFSIFAAISNALYSYLFSKEPLQVNFFFSKNMKKEIKKLINENNFKFINLFLIRSIKNLPDFEGKIFLDAVDSMYLNFKSKKTNNIFKRLVYNSEIFRLKKYEKNISSKFYSSILVSKKDSKYFKNSFVVPLGVNLSPSINKKIKKINKKIIFTGNMSYEPNIEAVLWFYHNCLPEIISKYPDLEFHIVGTKPSRVIKKLNSSNVKVLGKVESIQSHIVDSDVSIAPMQSGSGMQFKILEAMASSIPVVSTRYGLGDIKAEDDKNIIIAETACDFSTSICLLLENPTKREDIGINGRKLVEEKYSWKSHLELVSKIIN